MGIKNAAPFFVAMMVQMHKLWDQQFFESDEGLKCIEWAQMTYKMLASVAIPVDTLEMTAALLPFEQQSPWVFNHH